MWKVTSKGLLAHKLRLALTALAIVLGVTFISGTLVLTDTLHNTFNTLFGHVYQNVDFEVAGQGRLRRSGGRRRPQAIPPVARHLGAGRPRGGLRRRDGHRLCPVRRPRREGHQHRGSPHPGLVVRPQPPAVRAAPVRGDRPHDVRTRW